MKHLMLGNAAVARGLYEAGCCVISSYPGTPSTEITEEAAKFDDIYCEWAPNEKVAMEVAFGASLAGKRSFCAMKHVGLNVAADPLFTVAYTGVNAGMVIAVADDPGMHSSQNEQDSRHYAIAAKLPMLEPADSAEALAFTRRAYEISEEFDTPVILKMCTRVAHSQSIVETSPRTEGPERPYEKNIAKYVMMPGNAIRRHPVVEDRMRRLAQYAETCDLNRVEMGDTKLGIITSSTSYQYVKEVFGEEASVLKLGMVHPMPEGLIRDFAAKVDRLVVVEELDPIIENYCRQLGLTVSGKEALPLEGEFSQNLVAAKLGGAAAIRASWPENIRAIKKEVDLPIFGINKIMPEVYDKFRDVIITPTLSSARAVAEAGADIVAVDCTLRQGRTPEMIQALLQEYKAGLDVLIMAEISTAEEGRIAAAGGADILSTTIAGYTPYSRQLDEPDYRLIEELAETTTLPINAEGRFHRPEQVVQAFKTGAWTVTVGSAITRPHCITQEFIRAIHQFKNQEKTGK